VSPRACYWPLWGDHDRYHCAAADVSVETPTRRSAAAGLVRAMWEQGLAALDRSPPTVAPTTRLRGTDPRAVIEQWGTLTTEVAPRVAPILLLIRTAAAADPGWRASAKRVLRGSSHAWSTTPACAGARRFTRRHPLAHARDVMLVYSSPVRATATGLAARQVRPVRRQGMIAAPFPPRTDGESARAPGCAGGLVGLMGAGPGGAQRR
jgi:hypothetical protein